MVPAGWGGRYKYNACHFFPVVYLYQQAPQVFKRCRLQMNQILEFGFNIYVLYLFFHYITKGEHGERGAMGKKGDKGEIGEPGSPGKQARSDF